ncbi:hypothetical protein [Leeuwenhoekiella parthenopeia]|uniref:Uncharacterized protein n=1 Tax=Leeuwenhoekiella parthenopeia TaxID=2890320 RepID=A0ABS8GN18_9FLAO|nr:hypothetical protein [Leeuwenhoekiella parthenopeia]MCC4211365.1 hypothetical protein [Leeuwenhoekiella parthenopeia]
MSQSKKNPYADKSGRPLLGKFQEFFAWNREQELERRQDLPKGEVERLEAAENNLAAKMQS